MFDFLSIAVTVVFKTATIYKINAILISENTLEIASKKNIKITDIDRFRIHTEKILIEKNKCNSNRILRS